MHIIKNVYTFIYLFNNFSLFYFDVDAVGWYVLAYQSQPGIQDTIREAKIWLRNVILNNKDNFVDRYLLAQDADVRIRCAFKRVPPHMMKVLFGEVTIPTCHGASPLTASVPPTILGRDSPNS
jgi:hypothetical protein